MEERRKINLKKYASSPVSNRYLIKIIIYVVLFVVVGTLIYQVRTKTDSPQLKIEDVEQIQNITLHSPLDQK